MLPRAKNEKEFDKIDKLATDIANVIGTSYFGWKDSGMHIDNWMYANGSDYTMDSFNWNGE